MADPQLSQEDLAERLGVTRRTVGEWERTGVVPDHRLADLRRVLGSDLGAGAGEDAPALPEPITFTFEGTMITVHPNPAHTPEQVREHAREIFDAVMERLAQLDRDGTR